MTEPLKKAEVTLGQQPLAATSGISWKFTAGVQPFTTVFTVHKDVWRILETQIGEPLNLKIVDSRGVETSINQVYILHEVASSAPHLVSFLVADKRWKWPYTLVARDYNIPRKTGDRDAFGKKPIETQTVVDSYDYLSYSLNQKDNQGTVWTAKQIVEDVLEELHPRGTGSYKVESWPVKDGGSGGRNTGEFSVQNFTLRDAGDAALGRALGQVPGSDVYIDKDGTAVVFDATDLDELKAYYQTLPFETYDGEKPVWIDRKAIRPKKVVVHYQREIELQVDFEDDYRGGTSARGLSSEPFVENVIPTVDPATTYTEYDPEANNGAGGDVEKTLYPGTYLRVDKWLDVMQQLNPDSPLPWTFNTIRRHWFKGDLEGVLGGKDLDAEEQASVAARIQALRTHFRQTFRINRRYTERTRNIRAVRAGLLDPVTGARAPATAWAQAAIIPSAKGQRMPDRGTDESNKLGLNRNADYLRPSANGAKQVIETSPSPARVNIVDEELGIFRLDWIASPYGTTDSFLPGKLVNDQNFDGFEIKHDLALQDDEPMGADMEVEAGTNGIWLDPTYEAVFVLTIVPNSPNNTNQFHKIEVEPQKVASVFRKEFRIEDGEGPDLNVFIPPGEATARFAIINESEAYSGVQDVLGLRDPAGIEDENVPGYQIMNQESHLTQHAIAVAAEQLSVYADNLQGTVASALPKSGLKLVGNTESAALRVSPAPNSKVDVVHTFPGQGRVIPRYAVMPESTRRLILGIVTFR